MGAKRLSLDAFKAKANNIKESDLLEKIQGGNADWPECHTEADQRRKAIIKHNNKLLKQEYGQ
jgi:hypothetical protein